MEKISILSNNLYKKTEGKISFKQCPKKEERKTTKNVALPKEAIDTLKANVLFKANLKSKENQTVANREKQEVTPEQKQELIDFIKENRKDIEDNSAYYIAKYSTTKKHIELTKLLLTKEFTICDSFKRNLSEYEIVDTLKACSSDELTEIASDVASKTDMFLDKKIYEVLLYFKNNEPEKYEYIKNSPNLLQYENNSVSYLNCTDNLLKSKSLSDFSDIEEKIEELINKGVSKDCINSLLNLYYHDKDAYDYAINSKILFEPPKAEGNSYGSEWGFFEYDKLCNHCSTDVLSQNALKEIEKGYLNFTHKNDLVRAFVDSSDYFTQQKELHDYLSNFKVEGDFEVYRGEKDAGMFNCVSIENSKLAKDVKKIITLHYLKAKKDIIAIPNGKFSAHSWYGKKTNLYDYIKNKDELTLADAMLVAKYGNEDFIKNICDKINNCTITDDRFKSTTFSKGMATDWATRNNDGVHIVSKLSVKKGCEGVYDASTSGQCEFILNNHQKEIKFSEAKYNKEKNVFELVGSVENLDS